MTLPSSYCIFHLNRMRARLSLLSVALLVSACATQEPKPPTETELNRVATELLEQTIYYHSLMEQCGTRGPELKSHGEDLSLLWLEQYGDVLAGADQQYSRSLQAQTFDYQGQPLALEALMFMRDAHDRATRELRLDSRSPSNQRIICAQHLNQLETRLEERPRLGLDSERERGAWDELRQRDADPVDPFGLPTLGGNLPPQLAPGRSYYRLEEQISPRCPDLEVFVIDNEWPREAYGFYCESEPEVVVQCHWGECDHTP